MERAFAVNPDSECLRCKELSTTEWPGFGFKSHYCLLSKCQRYKDMEQKVKEKENEAHS